MNTEEQKVLQELLKGHEPIYETLAPNNTEEQKVLRELLKGHEPIYETLAPNEVCLLERAGNTVIYAANIAGTVELRRAHFVE